MEKIPTAKDLRYHCQGCWGGDATLEHRALHFWFWSSGPRCTYNSPVLASFLWLSVVWTRTSACSLLKCKAQTRALEDSPCFHMNTRSKHSIFSFQFDFHLASVGRERMQLKCYEDAEFRRQTSAGVSSMADQISHLPRPWWHAE